ncbi:glycosyltransferase family 4 protein [Indibacter alkaliphilus]|nr:glycosyltransferase family 1 protein [Indibacter alkaliphilus]
MTKKKRVLVDLFYLNTALTGIKTYMLEFCHAVDEYPQSDIEWVFTHQASDQAHKHYFRGEIPRWKKLWYHIYYFIWKQVVLPYKVITTQADVLLCFDFIAPAIPLNVKKITVIHDAFFWQMPEHYSAIWRKYFLAMLYGGLKGNTSIITTSQYAKGSILKYTPIQNPIEVIYQCPKLLPKSTDKEILAQLGVRPGKYLLHVGSFDKRKLLPVLVKAFATLKTEKTKDLKLVLVGEKGLSKSVDDFDHVLKLIQEYGLGYDVKVPGFLEDQAVKTLFDHAFAYVFPSSNEGFGIPVIEAMRSEIPVIISDQPALIEIAGGAALIHQTGNVEDLTEKIQMLCEDPLLIAHLVTEGSHRWKHFNRKTFLDAFLKTFE